MREEYAFSERRASLLMTIPVSSYRYRSKCRDEELRTRLVELARERPRFGYRRLHVLLRRRGEVVNHKRVHRVYREAGLSIRRKKRRQSARMGRPLQICTGANQEWALDFVHDAVACGRAIRVLSVVDAYTRECLALEADTSFASRRVTRVLDEIIRRARSARKNTLRQWARTNQSSFFSLVCGTASRVAPHSAGKTDTERTGREFQWTHARGVSQRQLVRQPIRCATQDSCLAKGLQRREASQQLELPHPKRICEQDSNREPWKRRR